MMSYTTNSYLKKDTYWEKKQKTHNDTNKVKLSAVYYLIMIKCSTFYPQNFVHSQNIYYILN